MRLLLIVTSTGGMSSPRDPNHVAKVKKAIEDDIATGKLIATGGIGKRTTAAARVTSTAGKMTVEDPPAGEGWMAAGDYSLIEASSKEEAIAHAKAKLEIMGDGVVELIQVSEMHPRPKIPPFGVIAEVTTEVLQDFADAWNRHDLDALMSFMTEDCVFEASAGPDICGTRFAGRDAVRTGFAEVWATFPDAHWGNARHFVQGERGVSEWTFTGTRADGSRVEVHGCDLFTFRDGKIALKNSYRKNRPPAE